MQQISQKQSKLLNKNDQLSTYKLGDDTKDIFTSPHSDWHKHYTADSQKRGYIKIGELADFWIHTGTKCNLHCPSCFEGSNLNPNRIEAISFAEAQNLIMEALEYGVKTFCFTGGEPFVNTDFIKILSLALEYAPCLVLTNATSPMEKYFDQLESLTQKPHKLFVRVSIDHPTKEQHELGRGKGTFTRSLNNCAKLNKMGHNVSIARRMDKNENTSNIIQQFQSLFDTFELPDNTSIVAFPDLLIDSKANTNPEISETCMVKYKTAEERDSFMCCHSMMATKKNGEICIYPCTLVNDDDSYIQGHTIKEAREKAQVILRHPRCFACFAHGTSCAKA